MEDKLKADDPIGCNCDEFPECTHALYFYAGVRYAETLNPALAAPAVAETGQVREALVHVRNFVQEVHDYMYGKLEQKPPKRLPDFMSSTAVVKADIDAALAAQAPQVAETGRTAIDEAQAYMLDRCLEVIRGEVPREAFTAADLAVSEALAAAQAPKPSTRPRKLEDIELCQWAKEWAETIRMNWGEPGEDLPGTLIDAFREIEIHAAAPASLSTSQVVNTLAERWLKLANDNEAKHYEGPAYVSQAQRACREELLEAFRGVASLSTGRLEGLIVKWRKRLDLERTVPMRYAFDLCISELEAALKEQGAAPSLESLRAEVRGGQEQRTCWYGNNTSCPYGATAEQPSPAEES